MNRRNFLGSLAAGTALVAAPAWLKKAFAAEPSSASLVFDAYRRARRARRPLLVFVIPEDATARYRRGHALGAFLNHAPDEHLAPLALCEVVCATMAHLKKLVPHAPAGEPLAVLIGTDRVPARVEAIAVKLDTYQVLGSSGLSWEERQKKADRVVDKNIARIGRALKSAIEEYAGAASPALAAKARARLVAGTTVPGARWARSSGCGTDFEDDDNRLMIGCGMAFVPQKSQRFLYLLAKSQQP